MTLPAFEAPVAATAPQAASAVAQPAAIPVQASPVAQPIAPRPVQANPFTQPPQANPFTQPPAQANPFASSPKAPVAPIATGPSEQPTLASSVEHPVEASSVERPVQASPVERPVHARPVEQPINLSFGAQLDDVNPIVRPVVEAPVDVTPSAPRVVEKTVPASPVVEPVVEAAFVKTAEPPRVEPATRFEAPLAEPAPIEPALIAAPVEPAPIEPALIAAPVHAGEVDLPVLAERAAPAPVPANAFETAPTEVSASETPIDRAEAESPLTPAHSGAAGSGEASLPAEAPRAALGAAGVGWIETPPLPGAESVVAEGEIEEQVALAQPLPAARSFTSSGSEMPVVITTPAPYQRDSSRPTSNLFGLGRELLPRAQAWSRKTLRANPRALVIAAPLLAVLGIWAVRSLVSHPKHAAGVAANTDTVAQLAAATPAPQATAPASVASPAAPILVSAAQAPSSAPTGADPAELANAVAHGLPALEALAQKFPNDAQVGIQLASQQAQAQRFEAAVESVERVIGLDAKSAQSGKVMGILWRAAQSSASEPSFAALRKLGGRGSDIAFDLATTAGVRDAVRERAKTELTQSLSADASADTRVASALLLAPDCRARKSLLARAEGEGGKRTQAMLEGFSRGSVCASKTDPACNSCLTGSPELTHALAKLSTGGGK